MDIAKKQNNKQIIKILKCELYKKELREQIEKTSKMKCDIRCSSTKSCRKNPIPTDPKKRHVLGKGAFGKVYKLTNSKIDFHYSVKSIKLNEEEINEEVKCVEVEIMKYRDIIRHRRIIEYFGFIKCSRKIYIFMEFAPNGSLYKEIVKAKSIPHQKIIRYTTQILDGIEFLHHKNVIHRDIKPHNILLDESDNIKLCDFGTSRLFSTVTVQDNGAESKTRCGTIYYMAPEVIIEEEKYSFPADIWSVGATIVHMLTGQPPNSDIKYDAQVMYRIATTRKIEYTPLEPMTDNMKSFMEEILNPDPLKRLTAKELLQFLNTHNMA